MNFFNKLSLAFILFNMIGVTYANETFSPTCPTQIEITEQLTKTPSGWRSYTPQAYRFLNGITLYSGKPEDLASLKPEISSSTRSTWEFNSQETIYLTCEYNQTNVQLTQPLPANTRKCTIWYDNSRQSSHGAIPQRIVCNK